MNPSANIDKDARIIKKIIKGKVVDENPAEVLVFYQPVHDGTGYVDAIEEGPWPKFQRVTGTNTELAGTCLCSISPNMGRGPDVCEIPWFLAELKTGDLALSVSAESWKAASASELLWEAWENEFTVYHRQTGETHILNALPAEIVHLLGETSMTTSELANELAVRCEVEETPEWSAKVTTVLENLYRLSLVEKASR